MPEAAMISSSLFRSSELSLLYNADGGLADKPRNCQMRLEKQRPNIQRSCLQMVSISTGAAPTDSDQNSIAFVKGRIQSELTVPTDEDSSVRLAGRSGCTGGMTKQQGKDILCILE